MEERSPNKLKYGTEKYVSEVSVTQPAQYWKWKKNEVDDDKTSRNLEVKHSWNANHKFQSWKLCIISQQYQNHAKSTDFNSQMFYEDIKSKKISNFSTRILKIYFPFIMPLKSTSITGIKLHGACKFQTTRVSHSESSAISKIHCIPTFGYFCLEFRANSPPNIM